MSEVNWAGTGGQASQGPLTWGGSGPRRVCDSEGRPFPAGNYDATVSAGMFAVTDAKFGTRQWVYPGEMVAWDGTPDPVRQALQQAKDALVQAGKLLGLGV